MSPVHHLKQGKKYKLCWSSNPDLLYKLISWDLGGQCIMESPSGKRFTTQTQDLRK